MDIEKGVSVATLSKERTVTSFGIDQQDVEELPLWGGDERLVCIDRCSYAIFVLIAQSDYRDTKTFRTRSSSRLSAFHVRSEQPSQRRLPLVFWQPAPSLVTTHRKRSPNLNT